MHVEEVTLQLHGVSLGPLLQRFQDPRKEDTGSLSQASH